jgi:Tfp pilus assembly protein PilV
MKKLMNSNGFSMLEAMVSFTILGIGMLCFTTLSKSIFIRSTDNFNVIAATALAQQRLESVKGAGYATAVALSGTEDYNTITDHPGFKRQTNVQPNVPAPAMATVVVTVAWAADKHSVSFQTIVAQ